MVIVTRRTLLFSEFGRWSSFIKVGLLVITMFLGLLFIATQSRAGYLSLLVSLAALIILPYPRRVGATLVTALLAFALFWVSPYRQPLMERFSVESGEGGALTSLAGRFLLWERAVMAIEDFPLTGVGLGMFRFVQPRLYPLYTVPPQADIGHAHNQFLQAALDVGIPGMIAYLLLWVGALWMGFNVLWRQREAVFFPVMLGLIAGWVGHFIWAGIEVHALGSKGGWFWWWALALIIATHQRAISAKPPLPDTI